ncbi:MAG: DNA polymerase III alpha subunit, partial [uncultured Gemmatimonadaceae bacterium]
VLRTPALPLGVLAPRRGQPDRRPDPPCAGARAARARDHRSREYARRVGVPGEGEEGGDPADPRDGGVRRARRPQAQGAARAGAEAVLPPRAARAERHGLQEPRQALVAGVHRGVLREAPGRPRAAREALRGDRGVVGLPGGRGRAAPHGGPLRRGEGGGRLVRRRLPRPLLPRGAGARLAGTAPAQRADLPPGRRPRAAGGRDQRRALPQGHRPRRARRAAVHRAGEGPRRPGPDEVRRGALLQERPRDAPAVRGARRRPREHAQDRRRHRGRVLEEVPRAVVPPAARGGHRERPARAAQRRRGQEALRRPAAARGAGAARLRARGDHEDRLRRLLPDRLRLHQGRARPRDPGGPGARLGRGLDRGLRARDHQRLPAQVRSPLRALPEPGARVDARHRRGLLLRAARRGDRVRAAEVRQGGGGADRHLRDDEVARGDQGRGAHPGLHARGDRRAGQARPQRAQPLAHRGAGGRGGARGRAAVQDRRPLLAAPRLRDRARGTLAPHGGARGRRGDRARPARRLRADPHRLEQGRRRGKRRGGGGDAVRHELPREGGHAQDGLPRPHHAHRGHRRGEDDRGALGAAHRPRHAAARRRGDLPGAAGGAHGGRLPVRVGAGHRRAPPHALRPLRRPRGEQRPAPPRPARRRDAQRVHPPQARRGAGELPAPGARADPREHVRRHHVPGAGDAHRAGARRDLAGRGRRAAQGGGEEGRRAHPEGAGKVLGEGDRPRLRPAHDRGHRRADRDVRPLRLQQVALGGVLGGVVPHGLPQDAPPRRVHGRAPHVADRRHRERDQVHQRGARARARDPAARRQRVGLQVHGDLRRAGALRPGRHPQRGPRRDRLDPRRPLREAVHLGVRPVRAGGPAPVQQARVRGPHRRRRARLPRRPPGAVPRGARHRDPGGGAQAGRGGERSGLALRRRGTGRQEGAAAARAPERGADGRLRAPHAREGDPRLLHLRTPARAVPHRVRAVRHAHRERSRRVDAGADGARRGGHGHQAADEQAERRGVRAAHRGGLLGVERGARLSRGVERARRARPHRRPDPAQGRLLEARPGRRDADVHRRQGHPLRGAAHQRQRGGVARARAGRRGARGGDGRRAAGGRGPPGHGAARAAVARPGRRAGRPIPLPLAHDRRERPGTHGVAQPAGGGAGEARAWRL